MRQLPSCAIEQIDRLENVHLIQDAYRRFCEAIRGSANLAFTARDIAIEIGERLMIERGRVRSGEWYLWIKTNCPFSRQTADRYVRIANRSHVSDSKAAMQTLRQLYLAAGIIKPAIPHGQFQPLAAAVPEVAVQIEIVALYFQRWETSVFRKHFGTADRVQLEYWLGYLQPIADAVAEIKRRLSA